MSVAPRQPMSLRDVIEKYSQLAGGFGRPLALVAFGLSPDETERVFGIFDEDYHISRFFHFRNEHGDKYSINGEIATHVVVDPEIRLVL